ncbi:MAG: hypothetical protein IJU35_04830 [Paludibacteraceae bacterium]|nr:hypothetical protein [Paludibacteraceae bacterium]
MKYKFKATQTIYKYVTIDAADEESAFEQAEDMLADGDIRFDDEPYLDIECDINMVKI